MSSFNSTANLLINHLDTMADGKTEVHMFDQFARAALDVICKVTKLLQNLSKTLWPQENFQGSCWCNTYEMGRPREIRELRDLLL